MPSEAITAAKACGLAEQKKFPRTGIVVARSVAELADHLDEWSALASSAVEPNVFYEPWMLLPAIEAFGPGKDLRFVLVFTTLDGPPTGRATLCGFFPLERRRACQGVPAATLSLWRYRHCFLGTPLLRKEAAQTCLEMFFDWAATEVPRCSLLEFGRVNGDGPFHRLLSHQISKRKLYTFHAEHYSRALFEPAGSADAYLEQALSGKKRKELRRLAGKLTDLGAIDVRALEKEADLENWIEEFLRLEASGWKGQMGTALQSSQEDRSFFRRIAREAFARGRLLMLALRLNGEAIAMKCSVAAAPGSFALKVAFNEDYARYSPGVSLEVENVRRLHARPEIQWMDSCAEAGHPMIDHLWKDRRVIQTLVVSMSRRGGDFLVSILPLLCWIRRRFLRKAVPAAAVRLVRDLAGR